MNSAEGASGRGGTGRTGRPEAVGSLLAQFGGGADEGLLTRIPGLGYYVTGTTGAESPAQPST